MSTIGFNLRRLRKKYGMTQKGLASRARITQGTLSLYESDQIRPKIQVLARLADAFGVSVAAIDQSLALPKQAAVSDADDDPLLQIVIDAWPVLDAEERGRIAGIATGLAEQKKARPAVGGHI